MSNEPDQHHDITFMRGNPIHIGHESVVDQVKKSAEKHGGDHSIFLTRSQDSKKNPLTPEQKIHYAKKAFPETNVQLTTPDAPTLLHQASKLHGAGVTHLHVHVGSDRVKEFKQLLDNYNGQRGSHGYYNFKDTNVYPVGTDRSDQDDGVAGASATAMRAAAQKGDRETFHKMAPSKLSTEDKDKMMQDTFNGMNPPLSVPKVKPKKG